ncbi:MAG: hypothetical protein LBL59_06565 [Xanthomonadaceae bacterium]|jgi:hypothetical protein|nr:hypothetical protein [Xanthomonadaceae bacterium]
MKIPIIGASATLDSAVSALLRDRHEALHVRRTHDDYRVDLQDDDSVHVLAYQRSVEGVQTGQIYKVW